MITEEPRQLAGTPAHIFNPLHGLYNFTIDAAASDFNTKLERHWTIEDNALSKHWRGERGRGERVFCNMPWSDIGPWLEHAMEATFSCFLLPGRVDRPWWMKWKPHAETHYYVGRMQFIAPPGIVYSSNPYPVVAMLFGDMATPGKERWRLSKSGVYIDGEQRRTS